MLLIWPIWLIMWLADLCVPAVVMAANGVRGAKLDKEWRTNARGTSSNIKATIAWPSYVSLLSEENLGLASHYC